MSANIATVAGRDRGSNDALLRAPYRPRRTPPTEDDEMLIATYNLWNTSLRQPERLDAACEELARVDADVVALQEVAADVDVGHRIDAARYIADRCGYEHVALRLYPGEPAEGLAVLGKYPLRDVEVGGRGDCGLRVRLGLGGAEIALTNVHLDWENIAAREAQITQILEWIEERSEQGCYEVLCGDFNCPPDSSVYRFVMGQQTLGGKGVTPWHDLARHHAERSGGAPGATLDFWRNPRWRDAPTLEIPARVDWILLQDVFERGLRYPKLLRAGLFGTDPTPRARVVPSDHYGVYAHLEFGAPCGSQA